MHDYIVVDTETTGLSPRGNEIIQIGAYRVKNGFITDEFCEYVKTITPIPREIQQLTGITNEDVANANSIGEVLQEFMDFCGDLPFLAHNLPFDFGFLYEKSKVCGLARELTLNGRREGIDTLALSRKMFPKTSHRLSNLIEYLGIPKPDGSYHNALYDAYMTKQLYSYMVKKYGLMPEVANPESLNKYIRG